MSASARIPDHCDCGSCSESTRVRTERCKLPSIQVLADLGQGRRPVCRRRRPRVLSACKPQFKMVDKDIVP